MASWACPTSRESFTLLLFAIYENVLNELPRCGLPHMGLGVGHGNTFGSGLGQLQ